MDVEQQLAEPAAGAGQQPAMAAEGVQGAQQLEQPVTSGAEVDPSLAAAAQAAALPVELAGQLTSLEIPQLVDYSGVPAGQTNLMPAITTLIMQITQHLSNPHGNPQLALTFQPLVNMALQLQLQASVTDVSAMSYLSSALAAGVGAGPAAAAMQAFDPQMLMASATVAAAASADSAQQHAQQQHPQQHQQQATRGKGAAGRRRQQQGVGAEGEEEEEEEEEEDADWRQPWHHKKARAASSLRPQRQRKKSKLLQEYYDDDEGLE